MGIPEIPTIYYMHCPVCDTMTDMLMDAFYEFSETKVAYQCQCGISQPVDKDGIPRDERDAYKNTISNLLMVTEEQGKYTHDVVNNLNNKLYSQEISHNKLQAKESMMNTIIFVVEKLSSEIVKELGVDATDLESATEVIKKTKCEAIELFDYVVKEQDKARTNDKAIEKKTQAKWRKVIEDEFRKTAPSS